MSLYIPPDENQPLLGKAFTVIDYILAAEPSINKDDLMIVLYSALINSFRSSWWFISGSASPVSGIRAQFQW